MLTNNYRNIRSES